MTEEQCQIGRIMAKAMAQRVLKDYAEAKGAMRPQAEHAQAVLEANE